jgi:hypothetical protein
VTRTVDLDQLAADLHDLAGDSYTEHPTSGTRDRAAHTLNRRYKAVLAELRDLSVEFDHGLPIPASIPASTAPWRARSLLSEFQQILTQQVALQTAHTTTGSGGLLDQLTHPGGRTMTSPAGGERIHASKPGSRPPASLAAVDLLTEIETAVWQHDADLRDALNDHHVDERPWRQALTVLAALCRRLPHAETHPLTAAVARDVASWRRTCRVLLGYTGGKVLLANDCPVCGQQTLRVSVDMDSDITCTGQVDLCDPTGEVLPDRDGLALSVRCFDPTDGQPTRWSRTAWVAYLEQHHVAGLLTTEAAAFRAQVDPATIRQWKARGILTPVGGTARHPLWLRSDVQRVAEESLALRAAVPGQRSAPITETYAEVVA